MPPETDYWSPYTGLDALCGNPLLIDIEDLIKRGLLDPEDRPPQARPPSPSCRALGPMLSACGRRWLSRCSRCMGYGARAIVDLGSVP